MDSFAASPFGSLDAVDYVVIGLTAMASAMFSTLSGVGGGLILAIVLAPMVEVKALVPLLAMQGIITNINRMVFYFRGIDVRVSLLAGVPSLFGAWVGTAIYKELDAASVALLLGVFLLAAVPLRRYLARRRWVAGTRTLLVMGFVYGVIGSITVGGGLFILPVLLGAGLMGPALLGTDALIGLFNSLSRAGFYAWHGLLPLDMFIAGTLIGVCTVPGSWLAAQIVKRTDIRLHTLFMEGLIVVGGLVFLYRAADIGGWFAG